MTLQLLLVDDEMSVVETIAAIVPWHEVGIGTVHKAYSAAEALDILNMHPIDIVITDVRMPGMDGLELARHIHLLWKHVKCLLLTAHADFEYAQSAIKSNIADYLLKPIEDQELADRVKAVVQTVLVERESSDAYRRAVKAMCDYRPMLRRRFLHGMLQGKRITAEKLNEELRVLEIPVDAGDAVVMLLVRFKEHFSDYVPFEISLMEYAIANLAAETFEDYFQVWSCVDEHDYMVLVLIPKETMPDGSRNDCSAETLHFHANRLTHQLQMNVQYYLKKSASVLLGHWGLFPQDLVKLYNSMLLLFNKRFGHEKDLPVYIAEDSDIQEIRTLDRLYEPPALAHLMKAGHWEAVAEKLEAIFEELETVWKESPEHIAEAFFVFFSTFSYIAHNSGKQLFDLIGTDYIRGKEMSPAKTVKHLSEWVWGIYDKFRRHALQETQSARTVAVKEAQRYILSRLSGDLSLQVISDHLNMHPAYLSRLYKLETEENISDYITRMKMEKSLQLLKYSTNKIYEVGIELGYQNPHYFIKVFKKYFGMTPQEYRNAQA